MMGVVIVLKKSEITSFKNIFQNNVGVLSATYMADSAKLFKDHGSDYIGNYVDLSDYPYSPDTLILDNTTCRLGLFYLYDMREGVELSNLTFRQNDGGCGLFNVISSSIELTDVIFEENVARPLKAHPKLPLSATSSLITATSRSDVSLTNAVIKGMAVPYRKDIPYTMAMIQIYSSSLELFNVLFQGPEPESSSTLTSKVFLLV